MLAKRAFLYPAQHHGAAVGIEPRIVNERLQGILSRAARVGHALDDGLEYVFYPQAAFRADEQGIAGRNGQYVFDLFLHPIGLGGG